MVGVTVQVKVPESRLSVAAMVNGDIVALNTITVFGVEDVPAVAMIVVVPGVLLLTVVLSACPNEAPFFVSE